VTTVTTDPLSGEDIAFCRLAVTEVTFHTYVASNIGLPCHSCTVDVERGVALQRKLINIEERENILYYLEAEVVLTNLLRHSGNCAYMNL